MNEVLYAFLLTTIAGLSTGIGSAIAFFAKKTNTKFLSVSLGFSAGVMVYVSMIEIFPDANKSLTLALGDSMGQIITVSAFFGGMLLIAIIDHLVPEADHEAASVEDMNVSASEALVRGKKQADSEGLKRVGMMTALAIAVHNFPEGIATFISALHAPDVAIPIVVAIAIHNIPEGISVSVPIYYATGNRKKAFLLSFASGLSEPLGAIVGYLILMPFLNDVVYGIIFAAVGGIMVFISFDELFPSARKYGEHHLAIGGLMAGMAVMAVSLILL